MSQSAELRKQRQQLNGLSSAALAYSLPELLATPSANTRRVILFADEAAAEKMLEDCQFFASFRGGAWKNIPLLHLDGWEQSPYRNLQPSLSARLARIRAEEFLVSSATNKTWLVVGSVRSFLQAAATTEHLNASVRVGKGMKIHPDALAAQLVKIGYTTTENVEDPGNFSVRGGILDVFPPSLENPVRLEFFDDEIESVRIFNPETQRSVRLLSDQEQINLIPNREFACDPTSLALAREKIKDWCDRHDLPRPARERVSLLLSQGVATPEMDYLLPFFREQQIWPADLVPPGSTICLFEPEAISEAENAWRAREEELFQNSLTRHQLVPEPALLFQPLETALRPDRWQSITETRQLAIGEEAARFERLRLNSQKKSTDLPGLLRMLESLRERGSNTVIVANSQSQLDRVLFLLGQHKVRAVLCQGEHDLPKDPSIVALTLGQLSESFHLPAQKIAFLSEDEIFGEKQHLHRTNTARKRSAAATISMDDLVTGDFVVHAEHGIGRYLGISRVKALGNEGDFVQIEYKAGDKLYVPVYRLESLARYVGASGEQGALDQLGSGSFAKTKEKVKSAIKDIAQDLLRVQAQREMREGHAFSSPDDEYRKFEAEFPFDETPDQAKAIQDTIDDMTLARPMDRLICGDVGFGKTEVAIRAAFKAVQDGKQVAVLVPTTILAEQHYLNFSQRIASYPFKLASLSRFKSRKEQAVVIEELAAGKVDIVIGTHRLLSKDVEFKELGLVIIDEEQRFGVEHKERLKQLKATTDVLTLTATPIPRTLQMSLMGLKDVSIIRTPPGDRLSIKTHLATFDEDLIREAIRAELGRGGQVFFIHNRVQTIGKMEELLQKLVPEARFVAAHGQMAEGQLERAMIGFYQKKFDVLLATAIIENGLDVPNANTLIVNRADTFGLSQLYQIRGRVGRSQTRAHAYFLLPETASVTDEARERLSVLQRFVELGSGYLIATHDLEIRGGGDVLGQAQSGHIAAVGYEMYIELLQEEVRRLKGEKIAAPLAEVEINVPFHAVLPDEYVPDMKTRLALYRRLSALRTEEETDDARRELEDRYGELPKETEELLCVLRLKVLMRRMGLKTLSLGPKGMSLTPGKDPIFEPAMILQLVHTQPKEYSIQPDGKFVIKGEFRSASELYDRLRQMLTRCTQ